jgi:hypothetical protein
VLAGLVIAWRLATWPDEPLAVLVKATTDGTVRPPSALGMTVGSPPSITATTEFVVPRSMPMILPMTSCSSCSPLPAVSLVRDPVAAHGDATIAGRSTRSRMR